MNIQFEIQREALLKPLQRVVGAVERKQAKPILGNVLLSVKSQLLSLVCTDLEVELIARVPLTGKAVEGRITIPAKKFIDICKTLPEQATVRFECDSGKEGGLMGALKAVIRSGRSRFTLAALSAEAFPVMEEGPGEEEFSLPQKTLRTVMAHTAFAMAQEDVRYYLNGLHWTFSKNSIRAVATDGHRLALFEVQGKSRIEQSRSLIIPRKAVMEMLRLFSEGDEEVGIVVGANHLRAITTGYSFTTRLVHGQFPDHRRVLPQSSHMTAILDRDLFRQALMRAAVLLTDRVRGVKLCYQNNLLSIRARNSEQDEVQEDMEIQFDCEEITIGLNVAYLIEYLGLIQSSKIKMSFSSPQESVLIEPLEPSKEETAAQTKALYVVMPMHL